MPCRSTGNSRPYLLKPELMVLRTDYTQNPRCGFRSSISARLPFHQDEFDVVLNHCIRFVRFPQESRPTVFYFICSISNLVPDDRRKVVKAYPATALLNRGMQRNN